jgi:hypothetical protein
VSKLEKVLHPHPSISEGVQECARMLMDRPTIHPDVFASSYARRWAPIKQTVPTRVAEANIDAMIKQQQNSKENANNISKTTSASGDINCASNGKCEQVDDEMMVEEVSIGLVPSYGFGKEYNIK